MFTRLSHWILQTYGATYQKHTFSQLIFKDILVLFSHERQRPFLNGLPADKFPLFSYFGYLRFKYFSIMTKKILKLGGVPALEASDLSDLNVLYKLISSQTCRR